MRGTVLGPTFNWFMSLRASCCARSRFSISKTLLRSCWRDRTSPCAFWMIRTAVSALMGCRALP